MSMEPICDCPEYNHRQATPLGPHYHLVVQASELRVGDRMTISEVTDIEPSDDDTVQIGLLYDGGAEATDRRSNTDRVAVTRPVGHTHEILASERESDPGVLYCTVCDVNLSELPDEDEVSFK